MNIIIPLAGFGTRLRPHTFTKPKPLIPVAGKPVLAHILDKLESVKLDEVVFVVGYLGDQIERYVAANYNLPAHYVEQKELKGQADAIQLARDYVKGPVLIIFVDTLFEADLAALANEGSDGVLYVKEVDDPRRFGVVMTENGYITKLVEKPTTPVSNLAVIGLYYFRDSQLLFECIDELVAKDIKTQGEYFLADAIQLMIDRGNKFRAVTVDVWEDCGKPETVLHTNQYLLEHGHAQTVETQNSVLIQPVHVDASAVIKDSVVGPYVSVGAGARIERSIIQDSIVDARARIANANLNRCLIGENAQVQGVAQRLNIGDTSDVDLSGGDYQ